MRYLSPFHEKHFMPAYRLTSQVCRRYFRLFASMFISFASHWSLCACAKSTHDRKTRVFHASFSQKPPLTAQKFKFFLPFYDTYKLSSLGDGERAWCNGRCRAVPCHGVVMSNLYFEIRPACSIFGRSRNIFSKAVKKHGNRKY